MLGVLFHTFGESHIITQKPADICSPARPGQIDPESRPPNKPRPAALDLKPGRTGRLRTLTSTDHYDRLYENRLEFSLFLFALLSLCVSSLLLAKLYSIYLGVLFF